MSKKSKISLKEAKETGNLGQFVKEHEKDPSGDADKLNATIKSAVSSTPPQKKEYK